ncbi:hypothetical protein Vretimale_10524 [Volvox reticuliferus]|uniref:Uncharacterized protein n=1 Tax=Volvox reticuliferus TaxID=1737510 RepID=A0A8J4GFL0_9CHLO|nr:hypothetical protein Vretimale_10524 [Volvox reticuliferus]
MMRSRSWQSTSPTAHQDTKPTLLLPLLIPAAAFPSMRPSPPPVVSLMVWPPPVSVWDNLKAQPPILLPLPDYHHPACAKMPQLHTFHFTFPSSLPDVLHITLPRLMR